MKSLKILVIVIILLPFFHASAQNQSIDIQLQNVMSQISHDRLKRGIETLAGFQNRNTFSDTVSEKRGIGASRRWLYNEFQKINKETGGRMKVYMDFFNQPLSRRYKEVIGKDEIRIANVIAIIPGTNSERILHINGHYDSRTYSGTDITSDAAGANDDGSGTIALLELARVLAQNPIKNTVMLAAVVGEEQGLWGSSHIAETAKTEGWRLEGVIANDMIGNILGGNGITDNTVLRCFSPDPVDSPSRNWALYIHQIAERYVPQLRLKMIFRLDRFGRGGDHSPFIRQGFAGVRFTEPWENYEIQHSPFDTPDKMSFEYFTRTTQLNAAVAAYWAQSPAPPEIVRISRDSLYQTIITFRMDDDIQDLKGFRIMMRETDQGYWTESKFIAVPDEDIHQDWGKVFRTVLKNRDQDYYIFGLASVNREGYESIAKTYDRQRIRQKLREIRANR